MGRLMRGIITDIGVPSSFFVRDPEDSSMKIYIASSLLVAILGSIISEGLGCSDLHPTEKCEELKQDGRCDKWQMMKDRCQATCGFCNGGDEEDAQCVDIASAKKCKKIQEKGKCNKGKWKTKCIATCGFCEEDGDASTAAPATTPKDTDDTSESPSTNLPTEIEECTSDSGCECGDTSKGFTTYAFKIGETQRCFTVFHPLSRAGEKLPVVLSPNCYAQDRLQGISMTSATRGDNGAATKYGFSRIGLSSPDGAWTFGNDNIVNDADPMPCSDEDSKDIVYMKSVFSFIEANPEKFDVTKIYAEGFSQNSMFSAYTAFCFYDKVAGVWQGGSGMTLTGERPFVPNQGGQCTMTAYKQYGGQCRSKDPCTVCQYWPIYPCYVESHPMIHCIMEYTNDAISVQEGQSSAEHMYTRSINEGHDARLLRFDPSDDGTIAGSHKDPQNNVHWVVGCLGISEPCSAACETSFSACVNSKDVSTAAKRVKAFENCIEDSGNLSGCTSECAPTYNMLTESEIPAVSSVSSFVSKVKDHDVRPDTSLCSATEQV